MSVEVVKKVMLWIMMADEVMDNEEVKRISYVYEKMTKQPISVSEIEKESKNIKYKDLEKDLDNSLGQLDLEGRYLVLKVAVAIAAADGKFQPEEQLLIANLVKKFKLKEFETHQIIAEYFDPSLVPESIDFQCPHCGQQACIRKSVETLGKKRKCRNCQNIYELSTNTLASKDQTPPHKPESSSTPLWQDKRVLVVVAIVLLFLVWKNFM